MKIKAPSARNRRITALKRQAKHWWLIPEQPKKVGRLSQRNKANKRLKRSVGKSEFVLMAERIENEPKRVSRK